MTQPSEPLAQAWTPRDAQLGRMCPVLAQEIHRTQPYGMASPLGVGALEIEQASATAFFGAAPHVDRDFDRWFVMLVVKAGDDTVLHLAKRRSETDHPKAAANIRLQEGQVVVFDAHRLHWVDLPDGMDPTHQGQGSQFHQQLMADHGAQLSVLVGTETRTCPTRDEAEQMLCDYLRVQTPQCWARAGVAQTPTPLRQGMRR